ncbi:hypothetical protein [Nitratidesulfovibrio vulgaris]|uniref:hypothetical protein n=1 Tax=Nitratidesulfovibrio vulgaris TaxID=881 RepID=UPI001231F3F6|nr:hypothetical protein [Nitratidesulfovibrio vulgaris]
MDREQILRELESLLNLSSNSLTVETELQNVRAWDSIAVLGVISLADEINGRDLSPWDFKNIHTVNDIIDLILEDASL